MTEKESQEKKSKSADFELHFYRGVVEKSPNYVDALIPLAEAYTRLGHYEEGLQIDKRLSTLCKRDPIVHYNLACSYALVGKKHLALETLRQSIRLGYREFAHIRKDPDLKCLHGDPEFESLFKIAFSSERRA